MPFNETPPVRDYAKRGDALPVPHLTVVQQASYRRFLQEDLAPNERDPTLGLEALMKEVFPIVSYDETMQIDYLDYKLEEPRYTPDECRELRLTYGMPFRIGVRLSRQDNPNLVDEEIYLGELPILMGGGEFIINGAERVIVNQLHRSPRRGLLHRVVGGRPPAALGPDHPRARLVDRAGGGPRRTSCRCGSTSRPRSRRRPSCAPSTRTSPPPRS